MLENFLKNAAEAGFGVLDITFSPIKGPEGNIEYLGHLISGAESRAIDVAEIAEKSHGELK